MKSIIVVIVSSMFCFAQSEAPAGGGRGGDTTFNGLRFRSIGPAAASGRVTSFAVDPGNPSHFFVGVASGGVWKTSNEGITWTSVFDNEGSYSIGTVVLDPANPNTVWVGTGENNSQRSVSYGDGVYRSDDGGRTWRNLGLKTSEHIGRIAIDPHDSNVVYVAAQGPLWSAGGERGVFKTIDGGKTWKNVLAISENTGMTDIAIDPANPNVLIAAAYQRRRHQWTLIDGGPESGIYKSTDAGANWRRIRGIGMGDLGRIGVSFSHAREHLVYAKVEAASGQSAIYRSLDSGESWERRGPFEGTPMYYGQIIADPKDAEKFYVGDTIMRVSEDGGRTLRPLGDRSKHVDSHTVWVEPAHPDHMVVGCDGGIYESHDGGQFWEFKANLPTLQFYDVDVDYSKPNYYVYGGTQDNASFGGPSGTRDTAGIANKDWYVTTGGDGFVSRVDPQDPDTVYAESQGGGIVRFDRKTGSRIPIKPVEGKGEPPLRWNWDAPILISPHAHTRIYFGANKLFRSDDRGNSWRAVSGDLTRQLDRNALPVMGKIWGPDAVAKNASTAFYGNLTSISESPKRAGLIYVGTDDGLIQVQDDEGAKWRKAAPFPGAPENGVVQRVLASQHDENVIYTVLENHQNGDYKPYLFKSADRGKSWTSMVSNLPESGSVWSIAEDHVNPKLLFVGTEFGLYFTVDGGEKWTRLRGGLPTIQIRDLAIQRRENDLVVGTFGRGIYILDNYAPLRSWTPDTVKMESVVFPIKNATEFVEAAPLGGRGKGSQGEGYFTAENPPAGASITYYLRDPLRTKQQLRREAERQAESKKEPIRYPSLDELRAEAEEEAPAILLTVTDANGKVVRRLTAAAERGVQRITWDLRVAAPVAAPPGRGAAIDEEGLFGNFAAGHLVAPGKYKVALARRAEGKVTPIGNTESFEVSSAGGAPPIEFLEKVDRLQITNSAATDTLTGLRTKFAAIRRALQDSPAAEKLNDELSGLQKRLDAIALALQGDVAMRRRQENVPASISQRVQMLAGSTRSLLEPPTKTLQDEYEAAATDLQIQVVKLRALADTEAKKLDRDLDAAHVPLTPGRLPDLK